MAPIITIRCLQGWKGTLELSDDGTATLDTFLCALYEVASVAPILCGRSTVIIAPPSWFCSKLAVHAHKIASNWNPALKASYNFSKSSI